MSHKINTFVQYIATPANTHNFRVEIPELDSYSFVVQSTSMPSEQMRMTQLYVQGEVVRYPAVPQNAGNWGFNIPDSDDFEVARRLDEYRARFWDQQTGSLNASATLWSAVNIYLRDLNSQERYQCTLHGCWLQGRGDVRLSQSTPETALTWDYTLVYQYPSHKRVE